MRHVAFLLLRCCPGTVFQVRDAKEFHEVVDLGRIRSSKSDVLADHHVREKCIFLKDEANFSFVGWNVATVHSIGPSDVIEHD